MRTKEQHIQGLAKMKRNIYFDGSLIDRTDELQMACLNTIGTTFDEAAKPENQALLTAVSHLTGERINRFTHIHQNTDDLHKKQDMTRHLCQKVGGCIQRCMGIDATNAIYNVSYEADKVNNGATQYHENFKKWLTRFQTEDLVGCAPRQTSRAIGCSGRPSSRTRTLMCGLRSDAATASWSAAASCISQRLPWPTRCWWYLPGPYARRIRTMPWPSPFPETGTG